jgi:hypothetical protein
MCNAQMSERVETSNVNTVGVDRHVMRYYFTMVQGPAGPYRAGNAYKSESTAESWRDFVSKAHRGLSVEVESVDVEFIDGKVSDESRRVLDERFNLDA